MKGRLQETKIGQGSIGRALLQVTPIKQALLPRIKRHSVASMYVCCQARTRTEVVGFND